MDSKYALLDVAEKDSKRISFNRTAGQLKRNRIEPPSFHNKRLRQIEEDCISTNTDGNDEEDLSPFDLGFPDGQNCGALYNEEGDNYFVEKTSNEEDEEFKANMEIKLRVRKLLPLFNPSYNVLLEVHSMAEKRLLIQRRSILDKPLYEKLVFVPLEPEIVRL